jgi:hypothetical protein
MKPNLHREACIMKTLETTWLRMTLLALVLSTAACGYQKDVTVSREKIQGLLEQKFPIEKDAVLAKLKLNSPKVYFQGSDIGMKLQYESSLLGKSVAGEVSFHGAPVYKPEEGAFYLSSLTIVEFTVDEHNLSDKEKFRAKVSSVLDAVIPRVPLYRLKQEDFKHQLAKLLLKRIRVEGENLILTMGI